MFSKVLPACNTNKRFKEKDRHEVERLQQVSLMPLSSMALVRTHRLILDYVLSLMSFQGDTSYRGKIQSHSDVRLL